MNDKKIIIRLLFGIMLLLIRLFFLENYKWLTVWRSGSGRAGETPSQLLRHFWQTARFRVAEPLPALPAGYRDGVSEANVSVCLPRFYRGSAGFGRRWPYPLSRFPNRVHMRLENRA